MKVTLNGRPRTLHKDLHVELLIASETCLGDSGSPIVRRFKEQLYVDGVYTLSTGMCGGEDEASFYMDTKKYYNWIQTAIDHGQDLGVKRKRRSHRRLDQPSTE